MLPTTWNNRNNFYSFIAALINYMQNWYKEVFSQKHFIHQKTFLKKHLEAALNFQYLCKLLFHCENSYEQSALGGMHL